MELRPDQFWMQIHDLLNFLRNLRVAEVDLMTIRSVGHKILQSWYIFHSTSAIVGIEIVYVLGKNTLITASFICELK